jgi:hypothetical protein
LVRVHPRRGFFLPILSPDQDCAFPCAFSLVAGPFVSYHAGIKQAHRHKKEEKMRGLGIAAIAVLVFCTISAMGQSAASPVFESDGNRLLDSCSVAVDKFDNPHAKYTSDVAMERTSQINWCLGMVSGTVDAAGIVPVLNGSKPMFCTGQNALSLSDMVRVVVKYLNDHKEKLPRPAAESILAALAAAYPCK